MSDAGPGKGALYRWALFGARHRRAVITVWLLAVVALGAFVPRFFSVVESVSYDIPHSQSAQTREAFARHAGFAERDLLVVSSDRERAGSPAFQAVVTRLVARVRAQDGVAGVLAPGPGAPAGAQGVSPDATTVYATVLVGADVRDRQKLAEHLQQTLDDARPAGFRADLTGASPVLADMIRVEEKGLLKGEMLGIPIALVILFFACGSLVAGLLPVAVATAGLIACLGVLGVTSFFTDWGAFVESIVAMLGLGLGIDYTLLMIRRFREERSHGDEPEAAMARTVQTAGRTVIFSGATVMICLPSFFLLREPLFGQMAIAAMLVIALMVLAALTLVPPVLLALGDRIDTIAAPRRAASDRPGAWGRWAHRVMRRPWAFALVALAVLGVAASPAVRATLGVDYGVRALQQEPSGRALTHLEDHFPQATLAPLDVAITGGSAGERAATARRALGLLRADPRISGASVIPATGAATLIVAQPTVAVDSAQAADMIGDLRAGLGAVSPAMTVRVGGTAAESVDYTRRMSDAAPGVIALTLALSFLLLVWVFRSLVIPLKALIANLLSVGAAYGLLVLVFQEGHGEGLLDFASPGYLQSWMPLTLFVFIFGLSMDYEVFLVTRMREEWLRTGDNTHAVAHGLERTGGVVTSAATIMVAVFAAFTLTATVPEIKQFGFGLGMAVLLDATIVRAMLVPSVMRLAGRWNWWLPGAVDRALPATPSH